MSYSVVFSKQALKQLKKLDRHTASLITGWIRKNLEGCSNPHTHGKALVENLSGNWRYRIGDYRVIATIHEQQVIILVINIAHRSIVYKM